MREWPTLWRTLSELRDASNPWRRFLDHYDDEEGLAKIEAGGS